MVEERVVKAGPRAFIRDVYCDGGADFTSVDRDVTGPVSGSVVDEHRKDLSNSGGRGLRRESAARNGSHSSGRPAKKHTVNNMYRASTNMVSVPS